jgi:hypothetical protein
MAYEFNHNQKDASFVSTVANLAAGTNSATFDLEQVVGGDVQEIAAELTVPTEAGLSDTKVLSYTFKDSADGTTFAVVDPTIVTSITGAGGVGATGKTVRFRLPPGCRRYIRVEQTVTATPGTLAGSYTFSLLF